MGRLQALESKVEKQPCSSRLNFFTSSLSSSLSVSLSLLLPEASLSSLCHHQRCDLEAAKADIAGLFAKIGEWGGAITPPSSSSSPHFAPFPAHIPPPINLRVNSPPLPLFLLFLTPFLLDPPLPPLPPPPSSRGRAPAAAAAAPGSFQLVSAAAAPGSSRRADGMRGAGE